MWTVIIVLACVACVTGWVLSYVDDWSRDFSEHTAETDPANSDASLHPLSLADLNVAEVNSAIEHIVQDDRQWQLAEQQTPPSDGELHLVHRSGMFGFKDDVIVRLSKPADGAGTVINVRSQSRIGKGDLGQNPRNIRELLAEIKERTGHN